MNARRWAVAALFFLLLAAAAVWGLHTWRRGLRYVSTENAYVQGEIHLVAARIPGAVAEVMVRENQGVKAGEVLLTLDPADYDQAVARARAAVAAAEARVGAAVASRERARAALQAARAQRELARREYDRMKALVDRRSAPRQRLDQARAGWKSAVAQVNAAAKAESAAAAQAEASRTAVEQARAALAEAELRRSYCVVRAPADGTVSRKQVRPGQVVAPGQPLLAVVPLEPEELWVEANFKETQLERIRPGQDVTIRLDAAPGRTFHGVVESLNAGTGAAFSLFPPENATGSWVKVVQRLPVRIRIEPPEENSPFRLGLSAEVEVDTERAEE